MSNGKSRDIKILNYKDQSHLTESYVTFRIWADLTPHDLFISLVLQNVIFKGHDYDWMIGIGKL